MTTSEKYFNLGQFVVPKYNQEALAREWRFIWREPALAFYRSKYSSKGLIPGHLPAQDQIPITYARELRQDEADHPPYGTHRAVIPETARELSVSQDVSGQRFLRLRSERDMQVHDDILAGTLKTVGIQGHDLVVHVSLQSLGEPAICRALHQINATSFPLSAPVDDHAAEGHLALWRRLRPRVLFTSLDVLIRYLRVASNQGIRMRDVFSGGCVVAVDSPLSPEDSLFIRQLSDGGTPVRVVDVVPEVPAFIAVDCSATGGFHLPSHHLHLQVCDPLTGRELPCGEPGHITVSSVGLDTLWIKYDSGREGVVDRSLCECGHSSVRYTPIR
ncbi:hypothetical protein [Amycolatopsis jejuensis]|uniref:hypothetical protein n=1 Tax=Amycolatopsis jejuensis TaxID=330084 RepID=UPI0012E05E3C|nr:hypothetical protein [Amycolatopsis jejuensis]